VISFDKISVKVCSFAYRFNDLIYTVLEHSLGIGSCFLSSQQTTREFEPKSKYEQMLQTKSNI
jgi:hypothetical protein